MPNWCSNWITISGDKKTIKTLRYAMESVKDKPEDSSGIFTALVGTEPTITKEDYDKGGWYNGNIGFWGTKWDVSYESCNFDFENENTITMSPETAWSPPIDFGKHLARMYGVSVVLEYSEGGCDFAGKTTINPDGAFEEEDFSYRHGMYKLNNDEFWMNMEGDIECYLDDEPEGNVAGFLAYYDIDFLTEDDIKELDKMFESAKKEM
jgi:hypothetical protein